MRTINISIQILSKGKKRTGKYMNPTSITIHSTANAKSTAQNERDYLTNPINTSATGWHYVVDEKSVIMAIPPNEVAYHCGHKYGNHSSIGIEMCESGDREKVILNTLLLTKQLMKEYNIPLNKVVRHYDWTGKNCPRILNYNNWEGWNDFIIRLDNFSLSYKNEPDPWASESWSKFTTNNIIDGTRPKDFVTRQEVITILDRLGVLK